MKKDEIFFTRDGGINLTTANHIATMATEMSKELVAKLDNISFYDETVQVVGEATPLVSQEGTRDLDFIVPSLMRVGRLAALTAWLREAITAHMHLVREISESSYDDYGIVVPERQPLLTPLSENDLIGEWSVKKRNRYFELQALCAKFGKYIHEDEPFAQARAELDKVLSKPTRVDGHGRDVTVYKKKPSIARETVEDKFFELQALHRQFQQELNAMNHELTVEKQKNSLHVREENRRATEEYNRALNQADMLLQESKEQALLELQALHVLIPNDLSDIYEEVTKVLKEAKKGKPQTEA